ncbi:MAG: hypothetical protein LBC03_05780 [Nitrososphaerota archaeon]|jgi:uncharacterized protein (DUF4213/DUF364 family)|nr:hypothetical protein [Nitrososphaerota archaeon]
MCFYIGIEDLVTNALIGMLMKDATGEKFVTYKQLEDYGAEVIDILREQNKTAVLVLSRERTNVMFRNYSDVFEEKIVGGNPGIALKSDVVVNDLINRFDGYLALDVLFAFMNERSLRKLGLYNEC